jgi:hypothetical protein
MWGARHSSDFVVVDDDDDAEGRGTEFPSHFHNKKRHQGVDAQKKQQEQQQ